MKSIEVILEEFLNEQSTSLKPRTYKDYEGVIFLFKEYLNHYAYQNLDDDEREKWEELYDEDENSFIKMFGADYLDEEAVREFLDYFLIRKVMAGQDFMKKSVRVMKKLANWLKEQSYTDADFQDYFFEEAKDLPKVEELANLIYEHAKRSPHKKYAEIKEGYFSIRHIENNLLWLDDEFDNKTNIGPVLVTKQITDLCQLSWILNLTIGKDQKGWYILESGNVYRHL